MTTIRTATSPGEMEPVRVLFREYAASLGFDMCFENFDNELAELPGKYEPPSGCLLLATVGDEPAGCVASKGLAGNVCEMKRLYVRPPYRRTGLGRQLTERIVAEARQLGYQAIRLTTVPSVMEGAVSLYRSLGFKEISPYCFHPEEALYMELRIGVSVRAETREDREGIREVNRRAFGRDDEARLVDALRSGGYSRLSLVAEENGKTVGHILFSELPILTEGGRTEALALAPLAVIPDRQRQGIGSLLVRNGLKACAEAGHRIVVVLGHPDFYPRFGFSAYQAGKLKAPFSGPAFMALELVEGALFGVTGEVSYPPPFGLGQT
jgi:putative acetyltransferase